MRTNHYLSPFVISLTIVIPVSGQAAQAIPLQNSSFKDLQNDFHLMMLAKTSETPRALIGTTTTADSLKYIKERTDQNKKTHIRMQQQYLGFPVFGGYAIIHSHKTAKNLLNSADTGITMNGMIYKNLQAELGKPSADFVKNASIALEAFKSPYQNNTVTQEEATPIVYINEKHQAFWAYKVSFLVEHEDRIPERPTAIIDAKTYKPFVQWNNIKTALAKNAVKAKGRGFGGNSHGRKYEYGKDLPLLPLSRDKQKGICYMENEGVKVVNMEHQFFKINKSMTFNCKLGDKTRPNTFWTGAQGDGYDLENGAYSPANDALYAGHVINPRL